MQWLKPLPTASRWDILPKTTQHSGALLRPKAWGARAKLGETIMLGIAVSLINLAEVALEQGDYLAARALGEEGLAISREQGSRHCIALSLERLATAAAASGRTAFSARLWGAAERLREEMGSPLAPRGQLDFERQVAAARAALGDEAAFDRAWQEGRAMTLEQAIELALAEGA